MICTQCIRIYVVFLYLIRIFIMLSFFSVSHSVRELLIPRRILLPRPWSVASNISIQIQKNITNLNMHNMATDRHLRLLALLFGQFPVPLNYLFKFQLCPAQCLASKPRTEGRGLWAIAPCWVKFILFVGKWQTSSGIICRLPTLVAVAQSSYHEMISHIVYTVYLCII